jgi:hypothetical protein
MAPFVPTLTPEQLLALQRVTMDSAAQAAGVLEIQSETVETFLRNVGLFVKENGESLAEFSYMLILDHSSLGKLPLNLATLIENIHKDKPVLYVNNNLMLIRAEEGCMRQADCSTITFKEKCLGLRIERNYCYVILVGRHIDEIDLLLPGSSAPISSQFRRSIIEFNLIVQDHKNNSVDREQGFRYWADRGKRILLVGPEGTEKLFHHSLFHWMKLFVSDALRVYGETRGMGQDKTDITVITQKGDYVIEVKWLGRNKSKTSYGESQINVGLGQVSAYLENDPQLVCGHLIVYDARSFEKFTNESKYDEALRHPRCQLPLVLFLTSDTPSEIGKNLAAERK